MTLNVDLEDLRAFLRFRELVNSTALADISVTDKGVPVVFSNSRRDAWQHMGVNNIHFLQTLMEENK